MTTTEPMTPISSKTAGDLLALLGELRSIPIYRSRADALCRTLGEALSIAGDHHSHFELMCMELLEGIARATGRPIPTLATVANVKAATDALEQTCPVLGNVIAMPRVPDRDTTKAIEAETARALADMTPPCAVTLWVDHVRQKDSFDCWAPPREREVIEIGDVRARVYLVKRRGPDMFEAFAISLAPEGQCTW